jgi:hypothetical protein
LVLCLAAAAVELQRRQGFSGLRRLIGAAAAGFSGES